MFPFPMLFHPRDGHPPPCLLVRQGLAAHRMVTDSLRLVIHTEIRGVYSLYGCLNPLLTFTPEIDVILFFAKLPLTERMSSSPVAIPAPDLPPISPSSVSSIPSIEPMSPNLNEFDAFEGSSKMDQVTLGYQNYGKRRIDKNHTTYYYGLIFNLSNQGYFMTLITPSCSIPSMVSSPQGWLLARRFKTLDLLPIG
jgi:hypothetical protein